MFLCFCVWIFFYNRRLKGEVPIFYCLPYSISKKYLKVFSSLADIISIIVEYQGGLLDRTVLRQLKQAGFCTTGIILWSYKPSIKGQQGPLTYWHDITNNNEGCCCWSWVCFWISFKSRVWKCTKNIYKKGKTRDTLFYLKKSLW